MPQPEDGAALPAAPAGATSVTEQPPEGLLQIAIRFEEDSWAEVSDGNGDLLYYALGMAGVTEMLDGVPPVSFFLGNPAGVQISIDSQPYPVPPPQGNATTVQFVVAEAP